MKKIYLIMLFVFCFSLANEKNPMQNLGSLNQEIVTSNYYKGITLGGGITIGD
jgi:hypothetical protein